MATLLQFVLLFSVIIGIVGGCGMELHYIVVTVLMLKVAWMVTSWWRIFQQERDNQWLHRRMACGAAMILLLSLSQIAFTYLGDNAESDVLAESLPDPTQTYKSTNPQSNTLPDSTPRSNASLTAGGNSDTFLQAEFLTDCDFAPAYTNVRH